ncbi:MAG: MotE family protein [Desulfovibrio sp.]
MTRWQHFVSKTKLSKVLIGLLLLAVFKLTVLFGGGLWENLDGVLPQSDVAAVQDVKQPENKDKKENPLLVDVAENVVGTAQAAEETEPAKAAKKSPDDDLNWKALKEREKEIIGRERSLKALESDLDKKLKKLQKIEANIKEMISEAKGIKEKRVRHLVDVYSNMKPKQAAAVLETLEIELAVKILSSMKGRKAGEILTYVTPKKAAILSEEVTKLQIPFN